MSHAGKIGKVSARTMLKAFRLAHGDGTDPAFILDLEMLRHKDLDLSIKAGALLAFDALLLTAGLNPIAASPGAPLSVDAVEAAGPVWLSAFAVMLLAIAAFFCVRAIMVGEDVDEHGLDHDALAMRQRLFAAYCAAIDIQSRALNLGSRFTIAGGAAVTLAMFWSLLDKY